MPYFPYLRGKQYELILLRDSAEFLARHSICPIIEPVRSNLSSLQRAIESMIEHHTPFILVVNPQVGELKTEPDAGRLLREAVDASRDAVLGLIVCSGSDIQEVRSAIETEPDRRFAVIHDASGLGRGLADALHDLPNIEGHIFIEKSTGKLYQRYFRNARAQRIIIRDSFKIRKNADYDDSEHFSDLHITYVDEGMTGFGDYLIVGDEYSEAGGPAYAVAIHITYLNPDDDDMFVYHFKSIQNSTPVDPAGKFLEALSRFATKYRDPQSRIYKSEACRQFMEFLEHQHFPGLGKVKQISMQHHIEVIADYLSRPRG